MNENEYKELVKKGGEIIGRIEAFFTLKQHDHWGPNYTKRTKATSISFWYKLQEFKLDVSINTEENRWGSIEVTIPPPGAQHADCEFKHWVKTPVKITFDKLGIIMVDEKINSSLDELRIEELLKVIHEDSPRNDPSIT